MFLRRLTALAAASAVALTGLIVTATPASAANTKPVDAVYGANAAVDVQRTGSYPTCTAGSPATFNSWTVKSTGSPYSQTAFNDTNSYASARVDLSSVSYYKTIGGTNALVTTAAELKVVANTTSSTPQKFGLNMYVAGTTNQLWWDATNHRWTDTQGSNKPFAEDNGYVYALYSGGFMHEGYSTSGSNYYIGTFLMNGTTLPSGYTLTYQPSDTAGDNICSNASGTYLTYATSAGMNSTNIGGSGTITAPASGTTAQTVIDTLDFDGNGGTCSPKSKQGARGTWSTALTADNCSKPGEELQGFSTSPTNAVGSVFVNPGGAIFFGGSNTFYAVWGKPRTVADAPTGVVAVAGQNKVIVSWKPPANNGGLTITNYLAQAKPSGRVCVTRLTDVDMLTCTMDLPATNTKYTFTAQAINGIGWSAWSAASNAVSPYGFGEVRGSRENVLFGLAGTKVQVGGTAPGLAGLAVTPEYKIGSADQWSREVNAAKVNADGNFSWSKKFPASTNKQNVTVRFTYGDEAISDQLVLARGAQAGSLTAPRNIKVENLPNKVRVTWDPPQFDGGQKITGYILCASSGSTLCRKNLPAEATSSDMNLFAGRQYTITVAAKTAKGEGPAAKAKQQVSPVEASVGITGRFAGQELRIQAQGIGFTGNAKFRLEVATAVAGKPASAWRWKAIESFTQTGNFDRRFTWVLDNSDRGEAVAVRLVTPNGIVYSRISRP